MHLKSLYLFQNHLDEDSIQCAVKKFSQLVKEENRSDTNYKFINIEFEDEMKYFLNKYCIKHNVKNILTDQIC